MRSLKTFLTGYLCFFIFGATAQLEIKDKGSRAGLFNKKTKTWAVQPVYRAINELSCQNTRYREVYLVEKKGYAAMLDKAGKIVPGAVFDSVTYACYSERLLVKVKGKFALYDLGKGINKEVGFFDSYYKEDPWTYSVKFHILEKEGKYSLVNFFYPRKPSWAFDAILPREYYFRVRKFMLLVRQNDKYGLIDSAEQVLIPAEYDSLALTHLAYNNSDKHYHFAAKKNGKWGLVNESGTIIAPLQFDSLRLDGFNYMDREGTIPVMPASLGGKWGIIDTTGRFVVPCEYDKILGMDANKKITAIKNGKKGVIDLYGKRIFPFMYPNIEPASFNFIDPKLFTYYLFSQEPRSDCYDTIGHWGLADGNGKIVREANAKVIRLYGKYQSASNPDMSYADDSTFIGWLWNEGGRKTKTVVHRDSIFVEDMEMGHMSVVVDHGYNFVGGKTGIVNREGKIILPIKYEGFVLPCYWMKDGEYLGLKYLQASQPARDLKSEYIVDVSYPIIALQNKKWGLIDWKGKVLIPFEFDSIKSEFSNIGQYDEMNDSTARANHFAKTVFKVFKLGEFGFYSVEGKQLLTPHYEFSEVATVLISKKGMSSLSRSNQVSEVTCFNVVRQDFSVKKLEMKMGGMQEDPYTGELLEAYYYQPLLVTEGGSLNLVNSGTYSLLLKEWADDLILKRTEDSAKVTILKWSDIKSQLAFMSYHLDSIREPQIPYDPRQESLESFSAGNFDQTFFIKQGRQWYLYDAGQQKIMNAGNGFDSISIGPNWFTAWKSGRFEKFSYSHKGTFTMNLDMEADIFPDDGNLKLVARNCTLQYKHVPYKKRIFRMDEMGNELSDTFIASVASVPYVIKGEFNIYGADRKPVLNEWAEEIIFPASEWTERFSLHDTTSIAYRTSKIEEEKNMLVSEDYKGSLALRYGKVWKIVSFSDPGRHQGGFESVKFADGLWEAVKEGKTLYYYIDRLEEKGN